MFNHIAIFKHSFSPRIELLVEFVDGVTRLELMKKVDELKVVANTTYSLLKCWYFSSLLWSVSGTWFSGVQSPRLHSTVCISSCRVILTLLHPTLHTLTLTSSHSHTLPLTSSHTTSHIQFDTRVKQTQLRDLTQKESRHLSNTVTLPTPHSLTPACTLPPRGDTIPSNEPGPHPFPFNR